MGISREQETSKLELLLFLDPVYLSLILIAALSMKVCTDIVSSFEVNSFSPPRILNLLWNSRKDKVRSVSILYRNTVSIKV